jgi:hypothetical protein
VEIRVLKTKPELNGLSGIVLSSAPIGLDKDRWRIIVQIPSKPGQPPHVPTFEIIGLKRDNFEVRQKTVETREELSQLFTTKDNLDKVIGELVATSGGSSNESTSSEEMLKRRRMGGGQGRQRDFEIGRNPPDISSSQEREKRGRRWSAKMPWRRSRIPATKAPALKRCARVVANIIENAALDIAKVPNIIENTAHDIAKVPNVE